MQPILNNNVPAPSVKTTLCFVMSGGGKSEAHRLFKEVLDADIGQSKLLNHVSLAEDFVKAGGKPVALHKSGNEPALTIFEFSHAKNTVAVQGKYEQRIYHPDHPKPTLDILARQIDRARGSIIAIPLEPESLALLMSFKKDARFNDTVIAFARPSDDELSKESLDKRYEKRGNNEVFRQQKKKDFSPFLKKVDDICAVNPDYKQIVLQKTKRISDGVSFNDIEFLSEALFREGFSLTELSPKQQEEKGMPPTSVFFANLHHADKKVSDKNLPLKLGSEEESDLLERKLLAMVKKNREPLTYPHALT